ncbi:importin subunit alpha-1b [Panicum miliaceum]|uniref:Importin subunit alpha n=1 Tax=Panicum miliaceum TaxID=4540 RepID=A0A3L6SKM8_PANMI|nr:importin subunit alpha-1b [Panicum miliaceum]
MSLRPSEQAGHRRSSFKASVSAADGRRRRVSCMDGIRKEVRSSALRRKRCGGPEAAPLAHPVALWKMLANLPHLVAGLYSDDSRVQLEAAREFRKMLSIDRYPPIQEVVNCEVLPCLVRLLSREDYPELQFEAAWALTNIASGTSENTMLVVNTGAVPSFVKLLGSPSEDAVWALGNVAGDSAECRDIVLAHGALFPLLQLLIENPRASLLRNGTWCLSNLCHGKPNFEHVKPALLVLRQLIHSEDEDVLTHACWALSYLFPGGDNTQSVIETGACPRLVELLSHPSPSVLFPSLRVVGSIASGDEAHTQCIVDHQALPYLLNLLVTNQKTSIKKKLAGQSPTSQLETGSRFRYLVDQGCIKAFCDFLGYSNPSILKVCLEGLMNILKVGEAEKSLGACDVNIYAQMIEDADALDKIEDLQNHDDNMIYQMATFLLETVLGRGR